MTTTVATEATNMWSVYVWVMEGAEANHSWHNDLHHAITTIEGIVHKYEVDENDEGVVYEVLTSLIPKYVLYDVETYSTVKAYIIENKLGMILMTLKSISRLTAMQREHTLEMLYKRIPSLHKNLRRMWSNFTK